MASEDSKNSHVSIVKKCERTIFHTDEFHYTWVIENFIKWKEVGNKFDVVSPVITILNFEDEYKFQLIIYHRVDVDCYSIVTHNKIHINLKVLSCPTRERHVIITRYFGTSEPLDHHSFEKVVFIRKYDQISDDGVDQKHSSIFDSCDSNGNITVNCKFTFHGSVPRNKIGDHDLKRVTVLSKSSILDEYEELLDSAKYSDVTLVVGDKKFPAHKAILATRSPVFAAMFDHDMLENKENIVKITDVQPEIMAELLRFIYSSKVKNLKESTADLLAAADIYQLETLRLMCEEVFVEKLSLDNLAEILRIVDKYETCQRLRDCVLEFLACNAKEVTNLKNYVMIMKNLSPLLLIEVTKVMVQ